MSQDTPNATAGNTAARLGGCSEFREGDLIGGRYQVLSCLGKGGMGVVYKVEQVFLRQELALKTLLSNNASDTSIRRFQLEGQATFSLDHPNLISVNDLGILDDGTPYLVMEFIKGQTLSNYLRAKGRVQYKEAAKIFARVCLGLAHAHHTGIVHRDIKPSNLMLTGKDLDAEDCVKVMDFGIAKIMRNEVQEAQALTKTGEVMGSPLYMSPEQCSGSMVDYRSDIYSLGCVFYECLTGAPPFIGDSALSTLTKHLSETPPSLKEASLGINFPPALEAMVARMLAKSPEERYQDLGEVAIDLATLTTDDTTSSHRAVPSAVSLKRKKPVNTVSVGKKTLAALILAPFITAAVVYTFCQPAKEKTDSHPSTVQQEDHSQQTSAKLQQDDDETFSGSQRPFSKVVKRNGEVVRIFNFDGAQFGKLSVLNGEEAGTNNVFHDDKPLLLKRTQSGDVVVPVTDRVRLTVDMGSFMKHPDWLNRFDSQGLSSLTIMQTASGIPDYKDPPDQNSIDETFAFLTNLKSLEKLDLRKAPISAMALRCMRIEELPRLRELLLADTNIDGTQLVQQRKGLLLRLRRLDLSGLEHVPAVLAVLQDSKNIENLWLSNAHLTDSDMDYVGHMSNLRILCLDTNKITDAGLKKLGGLTHLTNLWASTIPLTESSIPALAKFTRLQGVRLPPSMKGLDSKLKKALPAGCGISYPERDPHGFFE